MDLSKAFDMLKAYGFDVKALTFIHRHQRTKVGDKFSK